MKRALRWLGGGLLLLVLACGLLFVNVWYFKPLSIDWFYFRTFAQFALEQPQLLSSLRILPPVLNIWNGDLDDASPAAQERAAVQLRAALDTLHRYDRAALDPEGRLSYDTLEHYLRIRVEGDRFRQHNFPVSQLYGIQTGTPDFLVQQHPVDDARDARDYLSRLAKISTQFDQLIVSLREREAKGIIPPQFAVERVLAQMREFNALPPQRNPLYVSLKEKLDAIPAERMDTKARADTLAQAEQSIQRDVQPAFARLIAFMAAQLSKAQGNRGAWSLPDGAAYYAWCVRLHTTSEMTPEHLHTLGLAEVARIDGQMDAILQARGLKAGTIGARVDTIVHEPEQRFPNTAEGRAAILARYRALLDAMDKGLDAAFDIRPRGKLAVKAVPEFAQATAPQAYYQPGAFDGSRPGTFFANLRDTAETQKFAMATLAYHEGLPGHHLQTAVAQELEGLPFFRRVIPFTAYAEGWALYAERLAWEMGYESDPLDNLGRLRDEQLRATRLVVDTGIHAKRWTREQAITYMRDHTGMTEGDVTAEIERYFVDPGQALAYKAGMLEILALREQARSTLGPKFDLKAFHREVLTHGALPLAVLRRMIEAWIAQRAAA